MVDANSGYSGYGDLYLGHPLQETFGPFPEAVEGSPGTPAPAPQTPPWSPGASAASITAGLLRSQFDEWQKTFMPIELNAMNQISFNNPEILTKAVDEARDMATGSFKSLRGTLDRQNASMGITPTEQQKAVSKRLMNLNEASSIAGAENYARGAVRERDQQILLGTAPNPNIAKV
uniref:Uncharacterized protein n=1 Tax=viral metagenome TaxID=1070528 RepID=A0A6M3ID94_9ZZZZ